MLKTVLHQWLVLPRFYACHATHGLHYSELCLVTYLVRCTFRVHFKPKCAFEDNWVYYEPAGTKRDQAWLTGDKRPPSKRERDADAARAAALANTHCPTDASAFRAALDIRKGLLDAYMAGFVASPVPVRTAAFLALGAALVREYFKASDPDYKKRFVNYLTEDAVPLLLQQARDARINLLY